MATQPYVGFRCHPGPMTTYKYGFIPRGDRVTWDRNTIVGWRLFLRGIRACTQLGPEGPPFEGVLVDERKNYRRGVIRVAGREIEIRPLQVLVIPNQYEPEGWFVENPVAST